MKNLKNAKRKKSLSLVMAVCLCFSLAISLSACAEDPASIETGATQSSAETAQKENAEEKSSNAPEWKKFLTEYEKWADDYVALLKKYSDNPTDASLIAEYTKCMEMLSDWPDKVAKVQKDLANDPAALKEYTDTVTKIAEKLSKAVS